ncbi:DUF1810 domain-containing protein [Agrobacterium vacciniicorymbosi]
MQFKLERFIAAQKITYEVALGELQAGKKRSHWMWFIFPQIAGLGTSETARLYAISGLVEARAYLDHPLLGARLVECTEAMLSHSDHSAHDILGSPDDMKFHSCMTLFSAVSETDVLFERAIHRFYDGKRDEETMSRL